MVTAPIDEMLSRVRVDVHIAVFHAVNISIVVNVYFVEIIFHFDLNFVNPIDKRFCHISL